MIRRAYANGDLYVGTYEGWYCPSEGFRAESDIVRDGDTVRCPNHPSVPLEWVAEKNWFFRLSAYQERIERLFAERPDFVQPEYRRNEMLAFLANGLEDFSISREHVSWGIPFPIRPDGSPALLPDGSRRRDRGPHLRVVRRPGQLHHRRRLSGRHGHVRAAGGRPTCTSSARTSIASTRSTGRRC